VLELMEAEADARRPRANQIQDAIRQATARVRQASEAITEASIRVAHEQQMDFLPAAAPFGKTWHELVLKDMVAEAARRGLDGVAWTSGQQQIARYKSQDDGLDERQKEGMRKFYD